MPELEHSPRVSDGRGFEFVLSDGERDNHGTRINPNGWELTRFKRNPVALFGHGRDAAHGSMPIGLWENVRVEGGRLVARLAMAAAGTSRRIDELRSLIDQGILRGVSAGFRPIEEGKRGGQFDFERQELLEASIVAVPSNANTLALARALNVSDETLSYAFGEQAGLERGTATAGGQADTFPNRKSIRMDMNLSQSIEAAQNDLNASRDALAGRLKDPAATAEETDALTVEVEERGRRLGTLERAEKALAARVTERLPAPATIEARGERRPLGLALQEGTPEDRFLRAAVSHLRAFGNRQSLNDALQQYRDYPDFEGVQVVAERAATTAATTFTAGWAQELVQTAQADFLANLDPNAVFPRLAGAGTQLTFGPERQSIKIPSRASTPSIGGSFVPEGGAIPVRKLGLTSITLSPHKVGVISVFTREIVRYSNPQIEGIVREAIRDDTAIMLDGLLLDALAGSTTRPAGLLNGVSPITASAAATTYARILADITALSAPFYAVNAGRRLVLLLNPANAMQLSMAPGPDGTFGWTTQFTSRFTVFESTTIPANKVVLIDAADFVSVLGAPEFEVSEHATVHMEDTTPLPLVTGAQGSGVVASPSSSLWQEAKIGLRMLLDATWAMRRTGMVQTITTVNWA